MTLKEVLDILDKKIDFYEKEYQSANAPNGIAYLHDELDYLIKLRNALEPLNGLEDDE